MVFSNYDYFLLCLLRDYPKIGAIVITQECRGCCVTIAKSDFIIPNTNPVKFNNENQANLPLPIT
jgi:hypothetical protein